ncbi:hypothetical protein CL628_04585 [bacterium]|nr:hypothetical protein [bacterium]|tara:strand:+ start:88 stop:513 length:426 start_codon:yes stop_codon:yes gene_type:complete
MEATALAVGVSALRKPARWNLALGLELHLHPERATSLLAEQQQTNGFVARTEELSVSDDLWSQLIVKPVGYLYFVLVGEGNRTIAQVIELEAVGTELAVRAVRADLLSRFLAHCARHNYHSMWMVMPKRPRRSNMVSRMID